MTSAERPLRLFILGATGGTGRELVDQALARGHRVTAFVRSPQKLDPREGLALLSGNPLSAEALAGELAGHHAALSAIGPPGPGRTSVVSESARALVTAMTATGVRRLLILSVAVLFADAGLLGAVLRRTFLRGVADDSYEMEKVVRASHLDWTIVRPPRLTNGLRSERYAVREGGLPDGVGSTASIGRADLAHFLLTEVERGRHIKQVVGLASSRRRAAGSSDEDGKSFTERSTE